MSSKSLETQAPLQCLVCGRPMELQSFHGVVLDTCQCGIWLDAYEMQAVEQSDTLENIDRAFPGQFEAKPVLESLKAPMRHCLRCKDQLMDRFEWNVGSTVVMDRCSQCRGTWLDAGELEGYTAFLKRNVAETPSLEILEAMQRVQASVDKDFDDMLSTVADKTVRWDLGVLDDLLRAVLRVVIR